MADWMELSPEVTSNQPGSGRASDSAVEGHVAGQQRGSPGSTPSGPPSRATHDDLRPLPTVSGDDTPGRPPAQDFVQSGEGSQVGDGFLGRDRRLSAPLDDGPHGGFDVTTGGFVATPTVPDATVPEAVPAATARSSPAGSEVLSARGPGQSLNRALEGRSLAEDSFKSNRTAGGTSCRSSAANQSSTGKVFPGAGEEVGEEDEATFEVHREHDDLGEVQDPVDGQK